MIAQVGRLLRVSITVRDLARMERFYGAAFGFAHVGGGELGPAQLRVLGAPGAAARYSLLRLGAEQLELVQFDPPGRAYPSSSTARDLWFQHIAIVVGDMEAAYDRIRRLPIEAISEGGPQRLPPASGSVSAFKFRDPESHPLELIQFPPGTGDPVWQQAPRGQLFLGFDHSAIAVADAPLSRQFYTSRLGLREIARSVNQGPEQQRLDGLPDVVVDVVGLAPAAAATPHVELLGYHGAAATRAGRAYVPIEDTASARLVFEVERLPAGSGPAMQAGAGAVQLLDPDGHRLVLVERR